jgi:hypothetical protein
MMNNSGCLYSIVVSLLMWVLIIVIVYLATRGLW